jgi:phage/plasmid-like protein (TIGR03299 family)
MSAETMEWLNRMTLIGFTEKRGNAWHYRESDQGEETNHYPGAIPVADTLRRLFNFEVVEQEIRTNNPVTGRTMVIPNRKAMVTDDTGDVLGIFKEGYQGHSYKEWLINNVSTIIDDSNLAIGSAGLLKNRGQAWVTVEMPETISGIAGIDFRPTLLACTSFDGSLATTYKRVVQVIVCDNTLSAGLSEKDQTYKLKHSKYSGMKISNAREALNIVHSMAEDFAAELQKLTEWEVSEKQFDTLLNTLVPVPEDVENKRGITVAEKKRDEILNLYRVDDRSAPWNGTAFGALQAFNTWNHHFAQVRKDAPRVIRNMENVVTDKMSVADNLVLSTLSKLQAA